ncbi:molecular chaperone HtpG [Vallitalea okinawensis]|uniref:molecular chaperone HtpG n=1 Tax=Vallitalea okinawensis TaxID=2078660 RepID=UPI000CFD3CA7|nr:molecular chaperone HtpG [Vallitalea okinawensis]
MAHENGNLSIHSENIFPIIKKWLYSDKDIFIRELISNSSDAISKLKKLNIMGEVEIGENTDFRITVEIDQEAKTIKVMDNGIGMTADEVKKYINQIAFSGAEDFLTKYKDKTSEDQIIGHFGLGFYSAFMVASKVEIDTLSYQENAKPVHWICEGGSTYEMEEGSKDTRGTTITLHVGEDSEEFLNEFTLRQTIQKYCSFMPFEIYLETIKNEEPKAEETADEDKAEDAEPAAPTPLNDPTPLWLKKPSECTDEEYKAFYHKVFMDFKEPLFWIHLNMDYPLNLKGILYFPKLGNEFETAEGQVKLYCNQVFVADNIKEVIPEFLLLLKGVIDCPDFPLNVSRSFLQNDGYVTKISEYITKKVADKLKQISKKEKENFEKYWDDIHPFIKYGCLRNDKFYDKVKDIVIYKTTKGEFITLPDYLERNRDKHENKVFYVTDENQQSQYIKMFDEHDMEAVILPTTIDQPFISHIEMKNNEVKFARIDADLTDLMKSETDEEQNKTLGEDLQKLFTETLGKEVKVKAENLKTASVSAMILLSEESRRFQDMAKMYGNMGMMGMPMENDETLVVNTNNNLIEYLIANKDNEDRKEELKIVCEQVYDLAMLSHKPLEPEAMTRFIQRSNDILTKLI